MADNLTASMIEFLTWVTARPRTCDEAAEAWRSTCPRHTVWEDAFIDGFVRLESSAGICEVALTAKGRIALSAVAQHAQPRRATAA